MTSARLAPLCLATLASASQTTKYAARLHRLGQAPGQFQVHVHGDRAAVGGVRDGRLQAVVREDLPTIGSAMAACALLAILSAVPPAAFSLRRRAVELAGVRLGG